MNPITKEEKAALKQKYLFFKETYKRLKDEALEFPEGSMERQSILEELNGLAYDINELKVALSTKSTIKNYLEMLAERTLLGPEHNGGRK